MGRFFLGIIAVIGILFAQTTARSTPSEGSGPWKAADFGGVLSVGLEGHRSFGSGKRLFVKQCGACHKLGEFGGGNATDLSKRCLVYTPEELLDHLLSEKEHPRKTAGLLDSLSQGEVLDLLAFILAAADARSPFFFNP